MPDGTIPANLHVAMDGRVLLFVLALSIVTGVLFGIVPALKAARPDLAGSIKQGGIGSSPGHASGRFRASLVVVEVALAFMLLVGSGLLIRSFFRIQRVETGFDSTNVVTAELPIPPYRYPTAEAFKLYVQQIESAVAATPGVRDVALTSALPLEGWSYGMPFQIVGDKVRDVANRPACFFKMVGPSYFRAIGMRLAKGRLLDPHDVKGATPVCVINWPSGSSRTRIPSAGGSSSRRSRSARRSSDRRSPGRSSGSWRTRRSRTWAPRATTTRASM
jgi:putative ABC transport system permease protein